MPQWGLPPLPGSTIEETERWAWEAIKRGLAIPQAGPEGDDYDDDDDEDEDEDGPGFSRALVRRISRRGPHVLQRLEEELAKARAELAGMESARRKATEEARHRRDVVLAALKRLDDVAASDEGEEGGGAAASERAVEEPDDDEESKEVHALEEERRYLLEVRDAMVCVQAAMATADVEAAVKAVEVLDQRRAGASGAEYRELESWVGESKGKAVVTLRSTVRRQVEDALERGGWGRQQQQGEGGMGLEGVEEEVEGLLALLVRLQKAGGKAPGGGADGGLWAAEELARPILLRHAFHFHGDKATARADGGEWGLTFLLRAALGSGPGVVALARRRVELEARQAFPRSLGSMRGSSVLAFFVGDLVKAARRQATAMLEAAWAAGGGDEPVLRVIDQVLSFDRSLEDELGYPLVGLPAPEGLTWPSAGEALWCTAERLSRWAQVDGQLAARRLEDAWAEEGAWGGTSTEHHDHRESEKGSGPAGGQAAGEGISPPPAAQALGGAMSFLLERYRPVRDPKALKTLVIKVIKPIIMTFLTRLYEAVKASGLSDRVAAGQEFAQAWVRHCRVITAARFVMDVLDDATDSPVFLRVEATAGAAYNKAGGGEGSGGAVEVGGLGEGMVKALAVKTVASVADTTETILDRVVEQSVGDSGSTIIGPSRVIKAALGTIREVVKPMTMSPSTSPPRPGPRGGGGGERSSTPPRNTTTTTTSASAADMLLTRSPLQGSRRGGEEAAAGAVADTSGGSRAAPSQQQSSSSERVHFSTTPNLAFESKSLRGLWEAMIEDAIRISRSAFVSLASEYLSTFPPGPRSSSKHSSHREEVAGEEEGRGGGSAAALPPSPRLVSALSQLDTALRLAARTLEGESWLRLWQGLVMGVGEAVLSRVRSCKAISLAQGRQIGRDVEALAQVLGQHQRQPHWVILARGGSGPSSSSSSSTSLPLFRDLRETVALITMPTHSLESLAEVVVALAGTGSSSSSSGGVVDDGGEAMQLRDALEAKGLGSLSPQDIVDALNKRNRAAAAAAQATQQQAGGANNKHST